MPVHVEEVGPQQPPVAVFLDDAIEIVRSTQRADGRWPLDNNYKGKTWFQLERVGAPSRWNTLRALRVLKWWKGR